MNDITQELKEIAGELKETALLHRDLAEDFENKRNINEHVVRDRARTIKNESYKLERHSNRLKGHAEEIEILCDMKYLINLLKDYTDKLNS